MSPRGKRIRKLINPPIIKGFKPYGYSGDKLELEPLSMLYEEYESIKLCDYDLLNHHEASILMGVSRPTFTRIYSAARRKIATALSEGRQMIIEGGKVCFDSDWYICKSCNAYFNNPEKHIEIANCPLCGSNSFKTCQVDKEEITNCSEENIDCICTDCGYQSIKSGKNPCKHNTCPHCKTHLKKRKIIIN